jgi:hypothetical protein
MMPWKIHELVAFSIRENASWWETAGSMDKGRPNRNEKVSAGEKLVVSFGIPVLSGARCTFDKRNGTVKIARRRLLRVEHEVIPLALVLGMKVRRGEKRLVTRYTAIMRVLRGDRHEFRSLSKAQAKKAMLKVCAFLT